MSDQTLPRREVTDNRSSRRFEAREGDQLAGFSEYTRTAEMIVFTHTEVEPGHEGRGVGSELARHGMDVARAENLKVMALCPFVAGWLRRHPEYADLEYRRHRQIAE
jgi:predicted GNAT family acetyltransferase